MALVRPSMGRGRLHHRLRMATAHDAVTAAVSRPGESTSSAGVCLGAYVPAAGHEPPFVGFGEVALMAFVTCGEKAAPPMVPGLGLRAMRHYAFGSFPLMMVVTNRVAAQIYGGAGRQRRQRRQRRLERTYHWLPSAISRTQFRADPAVPRGQAATCIRNLIAVRFA